MSKYKYTSLLSSQYRQVFKSYHSLDRSEQELKDNLHKSLHKRIQTEASQIQTKTTSLHYQKPRSASPLQRPQTYLYYKTHSKYDSSYNAFANKTQNNYRATLAYDKRQNLSRTSANTCSTFQINHDLNTIQQRYMLTENRIPTTNYHTLSNNYSNYELKNKASQINKRRNDIKLNARVKDIDKINRKYEYLTEPNQSELESSQVITPNPSSFSPSLIQSTKQNDSKKSHTQKFTSSRQFSNRSVEGNAKFHNELFKVTNIQSSPLLQINSNKLQMIKSKQSKQLPKPVVNRPNDEQNIQTPHFHQTQARKASIEPSLISLKLENLVKNTFTDRY